MEFCDTFQRVQNGRVVYYLSAKLRAAGVRHGFSTRLGGVSTVPHLRQMNFGFLRGEDIETTREKYLRQLHRYMNNPMGYLISSGEMIIETHDGSEPSTENTIPEFLMIETDYKH